LVIELILDNLKHNWFNCYTADKGYISVFSTTISDDLMSLMLRASN